MKSRRNSGVTSEDRIIIIIIIIIITYDIK